MTLCRLKLRPTCTAPQHIIRSAAYQQQVEAFHNVLAGQSEQLVGVEPLEDGACNVRACFSMQARASVGVYGDLNGSSSSYVCQPYVRNVT